MLLKNLFENISGYIVYGDECIDIKGIAINSKLVQKDYLFCAIKGLTTDGHLYIKDAINNGAIAILVDDDYTEQYENITIIKVKDSRIITSILAFKFYNNPQKDMNIIGVTGTNGKTSTTIIIETILDYVGIKTAVLGTINNRIGNKILEAKTTTVTTPDSVELASMFNEIKQNNINNVVMETTSHALALNRIDQLDFNIGIFTNLTLDHLDFHKTFENYANAKFKLFEKSKSAVINIDDEYGKKFFDKITTKKINFSTINKNSDLYASNLKITPKGSYFDLKYNDKEYKNLFINLVGKFSVYNVLGAIGACLLMNIKLEDILKAIEHIKNINGRCELIKCAKTHVIVDYAHSPDGLENILKAVKEFAKGKIISVFGLGGQRETTKRPIMGELSGKLADYTIITSDNPRNENPADIAKAIESGIKKTNSPYKIIIDRKEAIFTALDMAEKDDVVVITGKGHENYQIYENGRKEHYSDKETVEEYKG